MYTYIHISGLLILQYNIAIASIADTFFSIAIGIAILF